MDSQKQVDAQQFMTLLPHANALNMQLENLNDGNASISLPYDKRLVCDPDSGVMHGGAISAVMDTCCGAAVMSHPDVKGVTATIDLRIEYMRSAKPGDNIVTRAECHHVTRSVAFVRAVAEDSDTQTPVATATGTFMVGGGK